MTPRAVAGPAPATARFPFQSAFLDAATGFVDQVARGYGATNAEAETLVRATEELLSFYVDYANPGTAMELALVDDGWRLRVTLTLSLGEIDLRAFNSTYRIDPGEEDSLARFGPMLAAHIVSTMRVDFAADDRIVIELTREHDYAPVVALPPPAVRTSDALRITEPTPAAVQHFAALVAGTYTHFVPRFLTYPGMAVDMLDHGALEGLLAEDGTAMVGGVLWRRRRESTIELFGPYVIGPDPGETVLTLLLEEAVRRTARSGARILLRRQEHLPAYERFFDYLGEITLHEADGEILRWPHYCRHLHEELGAAVYVDHGEFAAFLRAEYERLCLPRDVRPVPPASIRRSGQSALRVEYDRSRAVARLRPLAAGDDIATNLAAHFEFFERNGTRNIFVEIDTGRADDNAFVPALYAAGLRPRLIVPLGGHGDVALFTREP